MDHSIFGRCANCLSAEAPTSSLKRKSNVRGVSVREALSSIYDLKFPPGEGEKSLWLCTNCNEILTQLHHLFYHFKDLCRPNSLISTAHHYAVCKEPPPPAAKPPISALKLKTDVACQCDHDFLDKSIFPKSPQQRGMMPSSSNCALIRPENIKEEPMDAFEVKTSPQSIDVVKAWALVTPLRTVACKEEAPEPTSWKRKRGRPKGSRNKAPYTFHRTVSSPVGIKRTERNCGRPKKFKIENYEWDTASTDSAQTKEKSSKGSLNLQRNVKAKHNVVDKDESALPQAQPQEKRRPGRPKKVKEFPLQNAFAEFKNRKFISAGVIDGFSNPGIATAATKSKVISEAQTEKRRIGRPKLTRPMERVKVYQSLSPSLHHTQQKKAYSELNCSTPGGRRRRGRPPGSKSKTQGKSFTCSKCGTHCVCGGKAVTSITQPYRSNSTYGHMSARSTPQCKDARQDDVQDKLVLFQQSKW